MQTTLLTGATGTVGNAIARALVRRGRAVRALVRSAARARPLLPPEVTLVEGDVTDAASVRKAVDGCAVVYHAAGLPEQWLPDAGTFRRVNTAGTENVAEAALAARVERFVYTSTIDVFTMRPGVEFDEREIDPHPKGTAYEVSKQEADRLVTAALARGLPACFLHPSGVYGPSAVTTPGANDFLARLARGDIPMLLPGGMPVVYADDVAEGHLLAEARPPGARYILSDRYLTLEEIAAAVAREVPGRRVPRVMPLGVARAVSVVGELVAKVIRRPPLIPAGQLHFLASDVRPSAARARAELGWRVTPFADGLRATLAAFRARGEAP